MPLIQMCGFPSSGKTKRATELQECFKKEGIEVNIISDHSVGVDKNAVYEDSRKEKLLRGNLKSAVQRDLNKDRITVLDSLNYIKGFRYELYCLTKEFQTTQCVVYCNTNSEVAANWNSEREASERYNQQIFDGLVMRFEEPKSNNRWDSVLFVVQTEDILPFETIADVLFKRKAPPPNASTLPQPLSSTNFLYELDRITKEIVSGIMEGQKMGVAGDQITVSCASEKVLLSRPFTLGELQRHRRQFITYTKMHPVDNPTKLANMFVQYLNKTLH